MVNALLGGDIMPLVIGSPLWTLIRQSDAATWVILTVLLIMSIVCWTLALQAYVMIRRKLFLLATFRAELTLMITVQQLQQLRSRLTEPMGVLLVGRSLDAVAQMVQQSRVHAQGVQHDDLLMIRDELDAVIGEIVTREDTYSAILKMSAEAAPLLGLLGTIWGLIHSFLRMSQEKSADIITVAPGIAEALITTLMGLLVAIPALFFFHAVVRSIAKLEQELIGISDQIERIIRTSLMRGERI